LIFDTYLQSSEGGTILTGFKKYENNAPNLMPDPDALKPYTEANPDAKAIPSNQNHDCAFPGLIHLSPEFS
jgi:hypothetical protein